MNRLAHALRAYPTLLRIGFAEMLAYRAEMLVWILSTTMPLVNLALWHTVAAQGGPIAGYGQTQLIGYFLSAFIVRQLTGSWVVYEMNQEIRQGKFSMRLLRPVHPLIAYSAENLAAIPLRAALSLPVAIVALVAVGGAGFAHDPLLWCAVVLSVFGAWLINFIVMAILGACGFFLESSLSLMYVWQALFFGLSGYLFPLEFMRDKAPRIYEALHLMPFYFQTGFPIELILGQHDRAAALHGLAIEWAWIAGLLLLLLAMWRAAMRRWNAYGA
jgi:ABC-2 type transport system permease protein